MSDSDLSEIPSAIVCSALRETVEEKLKSKKYKINLKSASQVGSNNFMGLVYRVSFYKEQNENTTNPTHKMIVKVAPEHAVRREQFFCRPTFLREMYMYETVLPYFREFEQSKGVILEEDGFIEYPKCYRTIDIDVNEGLFLEDLSVRGFSMIDKETEVVTANHVRLTMRVLGKFHAISFALKDQQPDKFKEFTSDLNELFVRVDGNPMLREYFNLMANSILDVLTDEDALVRSKLKKLLQKEAMDIASTCVDRESAGSAAIITHGDTWQNNTMFRYDENGKPIEISLLDWQISRCSSPIIDLVYYLFACTTKELRDQHYDEFINIYHEALSEHIRKLGSDPEKLFSFELMMQHFQNFGRFGLLIAPMLLPIITADNEHKVDLDEFSNLINNNMKEENGEKLDIKDNPFVSERSRNKMNERLRHVAIDMARLGYI